MPCRCLASVRMRMAVDWCIALLASSLSNTLSVWVVELSCRWQTTECCSFGRRDVRDVNTAALGAASDVTCHRLTTQLSCVNFSREPTAQQQTTASAAAPRRYRSVIHSQPSSINTLRWTSASIWSKGSLESKREGLADPKVSERQQCVYEGP